MKRILVTGGCGFIGSNFINHILTKNNHIVLNYDKLTYAGIEENIIQSNNDEYIFTKGDICNYMHLSKTIFDFKPNFIVHFAAESHVDRSIENPLEFVKTNLLGTANILNITNDYLSKINSKDKNLFRLIHISTDEVYGSLGPNEFFTEKTAYNPSSPYSASKAGSDHLVRAWNHTFKLPTIITNCSNNYGPFQFPEKLIPLIIANCIDLKPLPVYGEGLNVRDWLYVEDHFEAIYLILERGSIGETYNIGGNNEIKNIDIVNIICSIMDELKPISKSKKYSDLIEFVKDRPGHDMRYAIDATKIRKQLNWHPKERFETGIKKTIEWYLKNEAWWRKIQNKTYNQERLGLVE